MVKPYAPVLMTAIKLSFWKLGRILSLAKKSPLSQIGPTTSAVIFRDPPRDSPDRVRFTMSEYGAPHEFTVKVDPAASAIMLRRVFDQSVADQRARIDVDGVLAGLWLNAGRNKWKIFAEDDLILDPDATAGKSELRIRITPESKRFTAAEYKVFSLVDA